MPEPLISTSDAKPDKLFYIVSNVAIVDRSNSTVLLLKRSLHEKVHPGKWALPGGKLEHADITHLLMETGNKPIDGIESIMSKLACREAEEECGLIIKADNARIISDKVFVRPDKVPVYLTILSSDYLGGDVKLEVGAFTDYAWVNAGTVHDYDCIDGLIGDVTAALA